MIPGIAKCHPLLGREEGGETPPAEKHMPLRIRQVAKRAEGRDRPQGCHADQAISAAAYTGQQASRQEQAGLEGCGAPTQKARRGQSQYWRHKEGSDNSKDSREK